MIREQSTENTKILFILEYYHPHKGGVEYLFKNLTHLLAKRGYMVTVLTMRLKKTKKKEVMDGVNVVRIKTINRYLFSFLSFFKTIFIARDYDIIHTTTFNAAFPAWIASKFWRKPCVITIHEVWINKWFGLSGLSRLSASIHNFLEKMIYLIPFDQYIAVSNSTAGDLKEIRVPGEKIAVIYNGFDNNFFAPEHFDGLKVRKQYGLENAFIYFSWGRPGISKGHEYLLKAVPLITRKIPDAKLVLMLSDRNTYKKRYLYLTALIQKLNIRDNVILIEPLSHGDLGNHIKAADCVVIPSLAEGFGFSVLEACAIDKPLVASDTTSIPEVIYGKYVLVEPGNPEAIAEGICKVYQGDYQMSPLKIFSWEDNIRKHEELYRKLI